MNTDSFPYHVFLSHSAKEKAVVRPIAERLRKDGLKVWPVAPQRLREGGFHGWVLKPGDSIPAKIEEGLEHSRVLVLCMSANALGSDWAQLEADTFRFRDPLNRERRFIQLRLDGAPIRGSLAQFLYVDWRPAEREREYTKLVDLCNNRRNWLPAHQRPADEVLPKAKTSSSNCGRTKQSLPSTGRVWTSRTTRRRKRSGLRGSALWLTAN